MAFNWCSDIGHAPECRLTDFQVCSRRRGGKCEVVVVASRQGDKTEADVSKQVRIARIGRLGARRVENGVWVCPVRWIRDGRGSMRNRKSSGGRG